MKKINVWLSCLFLTTVLCAPTYAKHHEEGHSDKHHGKKHEKGNKKHKDKGDKKHQKEGKHKKKDGDFWDKLSNGAEKAYDVSATVSQKFYDHPVTKQFQNVGEKLLDKLVPF